MIFRTTKLYSLILLLATTLLLSCVNNGDEPAPTPNPQPDDPIDLTDENLVGVWEVYYFQKKIRPTEANPQLASNTYRYPEIDGFTTTFLEDGVFYESNVFGMEVIRGTYKARKFDEKSTQNDAIELTYKSKATGKDTTTVSSVPKLYPKNFTFIDQYKGTVQGYQLTVEDSRYYRNKKTAPTFLPNDPTFNKKTIDIENLYGKWKLINLERMENNSLKPITPENQAKIGSQYEFTTKGGVPYYYEYLPSGKVNQNGEFKTVDDIIYMKGQEVGSTKVIAFQFWINNGISQVKFVAFNNFRDPANLLVDVRTYETFERVN